MRCAQQTGADAITTAQLRGDLAVATAVGRRVGDGFVPLQSQLMLDGKEDQFIYETRDVLGWTVPRLPIRLNMDVINEHTLGDPDKIRIWPGWSHLDTVTGRYNKETGHSELFVQIGEDLMGVLPES